jgi:hypothetical protein
MEYRVYLLDASNHINAAESFAAANDEEAIEIAASLHEACSDAFDGYEVWREANCISPNGHHRRAPTVSSREEVIEARKHDILDLADRLQRSFPCVGRSKKLLETKFKLRNSGTASVAQTHKCAEDLSCSV